MIDEPFRIFLATIYGESALAKEPTWKAIASVILNRVGHREWKKYQTPLAIIANTGFDAFRQENIPYRNAYRVLGNPPTIPATSPLLRLQAAVEPLYRGEVPSMAGIVLYYSPRAQAALHLAKPELYHSIPKWNFDEIEAVAVPGAESDDFRFYKYKTAPVIT